MKAESWHRAQQIFDAALIVAADERRSFVHQQSDGDEALATEVLAMLDADRILESEDEVDFFAKTVLAGQALVDPSDLGPAETDPATDPAQVYSSSQPRTGVDPSEAATALRVTPSAVSSPPPGAAASADLSLETKDFGKYQLLEKVGEGGFGQVYRARDPMLGRDVAIKTCTSADERLRQRFLREAKISAALQHPNIVTVFDFGYHQQIPFLVQEFLAGEDLSRLISRRESMAALKIESILLDAARGLAHAHDHGVLHRDVKPGNVRVLPAGQIKILDFGIARLRDHKSGITSEGVTLGTVGYLAPEQLSGGAVDERSDIFAFGVMAYELLCFEKPFDGETFSQVSYKLLFEEPPPIRARVADCPSDLAALVDRCLQKKPENRYSSFHQVIRDLSRLQEMSHRGEAWTAPTPGEAGANETSSGGMSSIEATMGEPTLILPSPSQGRKRLPVLAGLSVAIVAGSAALFFWWGTTNPVEPRDELIAEGSLPSEPVRGLANEGATAGGDRSHRGENLAPGVPIQEVQSESGPAQPEHVQLGKDQPGKDQPGKDQPGKDQTAQPGNLQAAAPASGDGTETVDSSGEDASASQNPRTQDSPPNTPRPEAAVDPASSQRTSEEIQGTLNQLGGDQQAEASRSGTGLTSSAGADVEGNSRAEKASQEIVAPAVDAQAANAVNDQDRAGSDTTGSAGPASQAAEGEPALAEVLPILVERVEPKYPPLARRRRLEATVIVLAFVGPRGVVERTLVKHSSIKGVGFEDAALVAARECRFTPGRRDDQPDGFWQELAFEFNLR